MNAAQIEPGRYLVTGANGYLGSRLTADLLLRGDSVRATVRSAEAEPELHAALARAGADTSRLEVVHTTLTDDAGWAEAVAGMDGVFHVASPMILAQDPAEIVPPARDGALRVLRAARDAGVPRVVLTSSFAAVGYGAVPDGPDAARDADGRVVRDFDESSWTDPDTPGLPAYPLSKAVAERAAWDFIEAEGGDTSLVVINPTWIAGPTLTTAGRSSLQVFLAMLTGQMPQTPKQLFGIADVRDVSAAHIAAMTTPGASGRYLVLADGPTMSFLDVARVLREHLGAAAAKAPTEEAPGDVPAPLVIRNGRGKAELGLRYRDPVDTIVETAQSLAEVGLL